MLNTFCLIHLCHIKTNCYLDDVCVINYPSHTKNVTFTKCYCKGICLSEIYVFLAPANLASLNLRRVLSNNRT